jgi:hypothetical protein
MFIHRCSARASTGSGDQQDLAARQLIAGQGALPARCRAASRPSEAEPSETADHTTGSVTPGTGADSPGTERDGAAQWRAGSVSEVADSVNKVLTSGYGKPANSSSTIPGGSHGEDHRSASPVARY